MGRTKDENKRSAPDQGAPARADPDIDYETLLEAAPCCLMKLRLDGTVAYLNHYALEFLDRDRDAVVGRPLIGGLITASDEMEPSLAEVRARIDEDPQAIASFETKIHRPGGDRVWLAWATRAMFDPAGELVALLSAGSDISERKVLESELTRLAVTDPLTGAYNRRYIVEAGAREAERARRYGTPFSILVIDIDFFKSVNDTYGHAVGDTALQSFTQLCRKMLRRSDFFGRMGGEEFAVLLPQADLKRSHALAERIREGVMGMAIDTAKGPITITASIGVAQMSGTETEFAETLGRADKALYQAKKTGRNKVVSSPNLKKK